MKKTFPVSFLNRLLSCAIDTTVNWRGPLERRPREAVLDAYPMRPALLQARLFPRVTSSDHRCCNFFLAFASRRTL